MKSSMSASVSPFEAQVLAMLEWWIESKRSKILSMLDSADPGSVAGPLPETVGFALMAEWDDGSGGGAWDEEFLRAVGADSFASFVWSRYASWWIGVRNDGVRRLDWEIAGRIGAVAKESGWIGRHHAALKRAARRLKTVKKVQEA